ncbi:MAG: hypothetical protein ABR973_09290 [Candidatus Acidiferrales bacterium]|jgi:NAD(P)-dependent dehydrogenase (short-subunit alcohol dehydrogenase family)
MDSSTHSSSKIAIVTGAGSGIGKYAAVALGREATRWFWPAGCEEPCLGGMVDMRVISSLGAWPLIGKTSDGRD